MTQKNEHRQGISIAYTPVGDYYIPALAPPEEPRSMGHWGRMHRDYLKEAHPIRFQHLVLSCKLWTVLADLNEQAEERMDTLIGQMALTEGITEALKARDPMEWVGRMNSIRSRAEEIVQQELIFR